MGSHKGRIITWGDKISKAKKGCKVWNTGMTKKNNPDKITYGCPGDSNPMKRPEIALKARLAKIGLFKMEKNPNWKGGISFEKYPKAFKDIRESIRARDKHECQICNSQKNTERLCVHHIDYNKKNICPNNLISLCRSCHVKTNTKREYWTWQLNIFMEIFHNGTT